MFKHRYRSPFIRTVVDDAGSGGGDTGDSGDTGTPPAPNDDLGFPAATPVSDMTPEQQAAYWRHEAKKQQKLRAKYEGLGDPDEIRTAIDAAEKSRKEKLSEHERAVEAARKEGHDKGLSESQSKWMKDAVQARIALLTRDPNEPIEDATKRVDGILAYIDAGQFVGDDGGLDQDKINTFAQSLGTSGKSAQGAGTGDPLYNALQRQNAPTPGSGGSVAAIEEAAYKRMNGAN